MALFRISGKLEENGKWTNRQSDFGGYFVQDVQNQIRGYVSIPVSKSRNEQQFIAGFYEDGKIVFVKMAPSSALETICIVQSNSSIYAYWDTFSPLFGGFFPNCSSCGHALLTITSQKDALQEKKVAELFTNFRESQASYIHLELLEDLDSLRRFWRSDNTPHD